MEKAILSLIDLAKLQKKKRIKTLELGVGPVNARLTFLTFSSNGLFSLERAFLPLLELEPSGPELLIFQHDRNAESYLNADRGKNVSVCNVATFMPTV
ncbi:hypothetical protein H5410_008661 [Solanum commersonii]|uniref:Uncharacterized protein n=1 Tax=Solanum commersonii TaxID=4109 RepID=A0A9J6AGF5_SOLCO|nr:hypothetical protein H5410_008661 [Solanum commersonii]